MRKKICAVIAILGFLWILGLAGASDLDLMSFRDIVAQGVTALAAMIASIKIGGFQR